MCSTRCEEFIPQEGCAVAMRSTRVQRNVRSRDPVRRKRGSASWRLYITATSLPTAFLNSSRPLSFGYESGAMRSTRVQRDVQSRDPVRRKRGSPKQRSLASWGLHSDIASGRTACSQALPQPCPTAFLNSSKLPRLGVKAVCVLTRVETGISPSVTQSLEIGVIPHLPLPVGKKCGQWAQRESSRKHPVARRGLAREPLRSN
ncbi:hypothetical protein B0H16DRAFT_709940 [Mycena metata]|uniref:Uncharacterized protein n=1 Tax=Mycena metata TaxID=1033252 RepID=A0AAD7M7R8_9AGAR|nr:hypothetical protein B0H16DRAFT_709940 [Mycena metata]